MWLCILILIYWVLTLMGTNLFKVFEKLWHAKPQIFSHFFLVWKFLLFSYLEQFSAHSQIFVRLKVASTKNNNHLGRHGYLYINIFVVCLSFSGSGWKQETFSDHWGEPPHVELYFLTQIRLLRVRMHLWHFLNNL